MLHLWVHAFFRVEDFERAELGSDYFSHSVRAGPNTDNRHQPDFLWACSIEAPRALDKCLRNFPDTGPRCGVGFFV
jgi:hypothetical protein